jgi:DNA polymerase-3 subunit epsilon/exodeoxyribonuclease X
MSKFVILDTETTGAGDEDRIIQLGFMVLGRPKDPVEVHNEFCTPPLDIKVEAMEVHGITPDMLEGKAVCVETVAYKRLMELNSSENYIIIHNAKFDLGMLAKEGFDNQMQVIDTLRCAKHLYADAKAHRLQYFRYEMGLYQQEAAEAAKHNIIIKAHDAIGDVLVLKLFVSKLVEAVKTAFPEVNPMQKLVELTQTPVMIQTFNFGKHKGRLIAEVAREDAGYLAWMQKSMDLDEDMAYTLKQLLG